MLTFVILRDSSRGLVEELGGRAMGRTLLWELCPLLVCGYRQAAVSEVQMENKLTPCRVVVRLETPPPL